MIRYVLIFDYHILLSKLQVVSHLFWIFILDTYVVTFIVLHNKFKKYLHFAEIKTFPGEVGGPKGPEPTRFGDWERKGRVTDF